jgi:hypothetical protein
MYARYRAHLILGYLNIIIIIIITYSVLRQVHSLYQSEFSSQYDLVLLFQFPISSRLFKVIQKLLRFSSSSSRLFYLSSNNEF